MTPRPLTLEWDENGLHLTLNVDLLDGPEASMDECCLGEVRGRVPTSAALELYEHVVATLGEWAREGIAARRAVASGVTLDEYVGRDGDDARRDALLEAGDHLRKARREDG